MEHRNVVLVKTKYGVKMEGTQEAQEVGHSVFGGHIEDLTKVADMELVARENLKIIFPETTEKPVMHLYMLGPVAALIATLNAAASLGIKVIVYHYNKLDKTYYPQTVL